MLNSQLDNYQVEAWDTLQHLFKVKNINDHTLHFVAKLAERLDLERFKKAVNLSADAFPLIRSSFNETKNKSYWEDKAYTVDDMLKILETSNIDKNDTLCVLINHMLCYAMLPDLRNIFICSVTFTQIWMRTHITLHHQWLSSNLRGILAILLLRFGRF